MGYGPQKVVKVTSAPHAELHLVKDWNACISYRVTLIFERSASHTFMRRPSIFAEEKVWSLLSKKAILPEKFFFADSAKGGGCMVHGLNIGNVPWDALRQTFATTWFCEIDRELDANILTRKNWGRHLTTCYSCIHTWSVWVSVCVSEWVSKWVRI